ncbi:MAG: hypothetical protein HYU46_18940 [Deltaproteobacteria bacterium]|nr:hypothetical protein [Deltaproteobacteria bacterium]
MKFEPDKRHRRSIRLLGYDYAQAGAYFVTIVTKDRTCLFGEIVEGQMRLNDAGRSIQATWDELPNHYSSVECDAFVVMPNHFHGIIALVNDGGVGVNDVGAGPVPVRRQANHKNQGAHRGLPLRYHYRMWCIDLKPSPRNDTLTA